VIAKPKSQNSGILFRTREGRRSRCQKDWSKSWLASLVQLARVSAISTGNNTCSQNGPTYVKGAAGVAASSPFLGPSTEIITIYAMLNPPALTTDILSKIAVTEIIVLAFPSFMASTEHRELAA
jgi:hypothetical protein